MVKTKISQDNFWIYEKHIQLGSETIDTSFFKTEDEVSQWFRANKEDANLLLDIVCKWREHSYVTPKGWKAACCTSGEVSLYSFEVEI